MLNTTIGDDATVDTILKLIEDGQPAGGRSMRKAESGNRIRGTGVLFLLIGGAGRLHGRAGLSCAQANPPRVGIAAGRRRDNERRVGGHADGGNPFETRNWTRSSPAPLQSNLNLRAACARVRQARFQQAMAKADFWPTIDANASYTRNRASATGLVPFPPGIPLEANLFQAGFDSAWELDVFGGTRRSVEAAGAELAAAEFGRRDVLFTVYGEVARNYVQARAFQRRLTRAAGQHRRRNRKSST